ncbi:MAG: hypothetical protein OEW91_16780 [Acidimicrobiia bacterium]|nr:hypothetical protein [Acidimicrobiia bacterium]
MTAVALIGCDGAGKTTVAQMLVESGDLRVRYVYMGVNAQSSNVSLPTTRLVHALKVRDVKKERAARGESTREPVSLHSVEHRKDTRGKAWAAARLVNRIAEEVLRQTISSWYQLRGYVVVYDRHFLFDYGGGKAPKRATDRIHRWFLENVYPEPDLVLFLDAPSEVLFARKPEVPISYLDSRRAAYLRQGERVKRFELVDATQSVDKVYSEVLRRIEGQFGSRRQGEDGGSR